MLWLLAFFVRPVLRGQLPVHGDLGMLLLVFRDFYARCLRQATPLIGCRRFSAVTISTGGGACGTYHPLELAVVSLASPGRRLQLRSVPAHRGVGGRNARLLAKVHQSCRGVPGGDRGQPFLVFMNYLHTPQMTGVLAHIPWLLAAIDWAVRSPTAAAKTAGLGGHCPADGIANAAGVPASLVVFRHCRRLVRDLPVDEPTGRLGRLAGHRFGVAIGVGLGAVQILPMYAFFQVSTRTVADRRRCPFRPWNPSRFGTLPRPTAHGMPSSTTILGPPRWCSSCGGLRPAGFARSRATRPQEPEIERRDRRAAKAVRSCPFGPCCWRS